jgi:hypothetical protein
MQGKKQSVIERFWDKVSPEPNTGCWFWTGTLRSNGYEAARPSEPSAPLYSEKELKEQGLQAQTTNYGKEGSATMYSSAPQTSAELQHVNNQTLDARVVDRLSTALEEAKPAAPQAVSGDAASPTPSVSTEPPREEIKLAKGWLQRQLDNVERDFDTWPTWMRQAAGKPAERGATPKVDLAFQVKEELSAKLDAALQPTQATETASAPQGKIGAVMDAQQRLFRDFEKYYAEMPYRGATKEALFHDWLYVRLAEMYAAAPSVAGTQSMPPKCVCGHDEPTHRVQISSSSAVLNSCYACGCESFRPTQGDQSPGVTKMVANAGKDKGKQGTPQVEEIAQQFVHIVFPSMDADCARRYIQEGAALLREHLVGVTPLIWEARDAADRMSAAGYGNWSVPLSKAADEAEAAFRPSELGSHGEANLPRDAAENRPEDSSRPNRIRSTAWSAWQVLGALYGIHGPARIMNWFWDVAHGEDREVSELFPITAEERAKYEWRGAAQGTPQVERRPTIDELELSVRAYHALSGAGIKYIDEIEGRTFEQLDRIRGVGRKGANCIIQAIHEYRNGGKA